MTKGEQFMLLTTFLAVTGELSFVKQVIIYAIAFLVTFI